MTEMPLYRSDRRGGFGYQCVIRAKRWRGAQRAKAGPPERPDSTLDPDAIAQTYLAVLRPAAQRLVIGGRAAALG
jgi:hypothetical protein